MSGKNHFYSCATRWKHMQTFSLVGIVEGFVLVGILKPCCCNYVPSIMNFHHSGTICIQAYSYYFHSKCIIINNYLIYVILLFLSVISSHNICLNMLLRLSGFNGVIQGHNMLVACKIINNSVPVLLLFLCSSR